MVNFLRLECVSTAALSTRERTGVQAGAQWGWMKKRGGRQWLCRLGSTLSWHSREHRDSGMFHHPWLIPRATFMNTPLAPLFMRRLPDFSQQQALYHGDFIRGKSQKNKYLSRDEISGKVLYASSGQLRWSWSSVSTWFSFLFPGTMQ